MSDRTDNPAVANGEQPKFGPADSSHRRNTACDSRMVAASG